MASYLVQSASALFRVLTSGAGTALTLPSGVVLYGSATPCRAAVFVDPLGDPIVVIVNGANQDLWIDKYGVVRLLSIQGPTAAPSAVQGSGTGLTGVYVAAITFKIKSLSGATLWESGVSPVSAGSANLANKSLKLANIAVASAQYGVNARGCYRSLSGGNVLYPWYDIDDNVTTAHDRPAATVDTPDAMLNLLPAPALRYGTPPLLKLICAWKDHLFGVARNRVDFVRWCEDKLFYAWPPDNELSVSTVAKTGNVGVTAFIPRRDQLGIARLEQFYQITGDSSDTFARVNVSETIGCVSQDSVVVVNNEAYFLASQGVAQWGVNGIGYISDQQVYPWFNSDTYFNRAMFPFAQGRFNPTTNAYELMLAAPGSNVLDRFVAFDLNYRRWFGPHKTDATTPSCAGTDTGFRGFIHGSSESKLPAFGSADGYIYVRDETQVDDIAVSAVAIDARIDLPFLYGDHPDFTTLWLQPEIDTREETTGGSISIVPTVGELNAPEGAALVHSLAFGHEILPMLGVGRYCRLSLRHQRAGETFRLEGMTLPYNTVGKRTPGGI